MKGQNMATTKAPTKAPAKKAPTTSSKTKSEAAQPTSETESQPSGSAGVPLPPDPSAVLLQEEQDELQQPGQVSKHVADQIDNSPGYSKDQLAHMAEYWADEDE